MDDSRPPATWPRDGAITFANYSTRYRKELDLVVKGISVDIKGGEKVSAFSNLETVWKTTFDLLTESLPSKQN